MSSYTQMLLRLRPAPGPKIKKTEEKELKSRAAPEVKQSIQPDFVGTTTLTGNISMLGSHYAQDAKTQHLQQIDGFGPSAVLRPGGSQFINPNGIVDYANTPGQRYVGIPNQNTQDLYQQLYAQNNEVTKDAKIIQYEQQHDQYGVQTTASASPSRGLGR